MNRMNTPRTVSPRRFPGEAYKELAFKVGTLHVVLGDQAMGKLELTM